MRFCVFVVCYCNLSWSEHSNCEHYLYLQYASLLTNIFSEFITNFAVFFCIIILQRERGSCLSRSHKILVLYLSLCNSVYPCVIQIAICLWVNEQIAYISYIFSMAFSDKHFWIYHNFQPYHMAPISIFLFRAVWKAAAERPTVWLPCGFLKRG